MTLRLTMISVVFANRFVYKVISISLIFMVQSTNASNYCINNRILTYILLCGGYHIYIYPSDCTILTLRVFRNII